ncbi:MAG: hypothetical protein FD160_1943, partial [Caulobacteraceae bacterium]
FGGARPGGAATTSAAPAGDSMPNPHGGPVGLMGSFQAAGRDARANAQPSDPGDTPPRGGAVG